MTITIWYCHVDHRTWVFVWHGSKQTEDLSVRLAAASTSFQTCRWGVEIGEGHWDTFESFDSYTKAQKLSILALRMQKRFCNTRKLKRTKTEKKKTENRKPGRSLEPENFVECKNCHLACQDDVVLVSSNRRFPRLLLKRSEVLRLSGQKTLPKAGTTSSVEHVKRENECVKFPEGSLYAKNALKKWQILASSSFASLTIFPSVIYPSFLDSSLTTFKSNFAPFPCRCTCNAFTTAIS